MIVVGYRSDLIRRWFDSRWVGNVSVTLVENPEYHKSNGISTLKAKDEIHENFLLLMADHIFEPETAKALLREPLAPGEVMLAVDPKIDRIYDLDDATKVRRDGDRIVEIGKEIACAALCCLTNSNQQPGTGTARFPMACGSWPGSEICVPLRSARLSGTTLTPRKP